MREFVEHPFAYVHDTHYTSEDQLGLAQFRRINIELGGYLIFFNVFASLVIQRGIVLDRRFWFWKSFDQVIGSGPDICYTHTPTH
jgi:hypothetical protein